MYKSMFIRYVYFSTRLRKKSHFRAFMLKVAAKVTMELKFFISGILM